MKRARVVLSLFVVCLFSTATCFGDPGHTESEATTAKASALLARSFLVNDINTCEALIATEDTHFDATSEASEGMGPEDPYYDDVQDYLYYAGEDLMDAELTVGFMDEDLSAGDDAMELCNQAMKEEEWSEAYHEAKSAESNFIAGRSYVTTVNASVASAHGWLALADALIP